MKKINEIERARLKARALWIKALKHDGIDLNAKFVCLSSDNPFDKPYNKAMGLYIRLLNRQEVFRNSFPII